MRPADDGATTVDLDAAQLTARLCAPITRVPSQSLHESGTLPDTDRPARLQRTAKGERVKLSRRARSVVHTRRAVYALQRDGKVFRGKLSAVR